LTALFPPGPRVTLVAVLGRPETEWSTVVKDKVPTRYPGVFRLDQATYWIRAKVVDPRTGKNKEIDRVLDGVTAHEAAQKRDDLINDVKQSAVGSASQEGSRWGIREIVDRVEGAKARLDDTEDVRRCAGESHLAGTG